MNFEDEMKELCEGVIPCKSKSTASASNMVGREETRGLPLEVDCVAREEPEDDGSKPLENAKHEKFANLVVEGKPSRVAYAAVFGAHATVDSIDASASRLLSRGKVNLRVQHLKERASSRMVLTVRERREFLASVVRTPVGAIDENSPLAQEVIYEESERGSRTKVKMPGKLEALKLDAEMAGELTPAGSASPHLRLRLIAQSSNDGSSIAAEIDGI